MNCELIGLLDLPGWHDEYRRVYSPLGIAPSVVTLSGGGRDTKVLEVFYV